MAGKTRSMVLERVGKMSLQEFPIPKTGEEDRLLGLQRKEKSSQPEIRQRHS